MKKFIKKILKLLLLSIFSTVLMLLFNRFLISYSEIFELEDKSNKLVLGDSQIRYAINDKILQNTTNFAHDGDSYFYSYIKIKTLKKYNSQIDTLILSLASHNLSKSIEGRWLLNPAHIKKRFSFYSPIMSSKELLFILKHKPASFLLNIPSIFVFPFYLLVNGSLTYGGYLDLADNNLEKRLKRFKANNQEIEKEQDYSIYEIEYLKRIVIFCKTNNIKLILLNTPKHSLINKHELAIYNFYNSNLSNIPYLDFSRMKLDDQYFGDLVHLNKSGAILFTKILNNELKDSTTKTIQ